MSRAPSPEGPWRLAPRPGEVLDRGQPLAFRWRGTPHAAYAGDTITSALAAAGHRVLSRSFKHHRPRGAMTASFLDPGCLVQVGDEPNVRASHRLVRDGMDVAPQNAWPSLTVDVKAANRLIARFLSAGFYYKTFMAPGRLQPAYQAVLRRFAPGGVVSPATRWQRRDQRVAHPDVVVAGGGPAGMAAAVAAADAGARVMLVEEEHELGGHLRWGGPGERVALADWRRAVARRPAIEVRCDAVVAGRYDDNWLAIVDRAHGLAPEALTTARAKVLIAAPGLIERPYVVAGNDLPGVMLSTGVRRLINLHAVKPGRRAVVLTANADGDAAVDTLDSAGVDIARVLDARAGQDLVAVRGRRQVTGARCHDGRVVDCDLVVTATGWTAPTSLLNMAGATPRYHPVAARFFPGPLPRDVMAVGGLAGDGSLQEIVAHAQKSGGIAARRALATAAQWRTRTVQSAGDTADAPPHSHAAGGADAPAAPPGGQAAGASGRALEAPPALRGDPHPALFQGATHGFVDFSEDVTSGELVSAAREGYDSAELLKRYTTATMGPPQGKLETVNAVAVLAAALGRPIAAVGTTVWRPPYAPVTLAALAGREHQPVRASPMQAWHEAHGATPMVAGAWVRPHDYGDPDAEVAAVRGAVGLIDVTPLGKLDLRGPDVAHLLNLLYVNKWSQLEVGRVRYGLMCTDDGIVFDDGVTGRLAADRYVMTTTSSGAAAVWEWVERWLQTAHPEWRVHVIPLTTGYASINLAGPRSRELLSRVASDVDLSPDAFPYLHVREATIAGVTGCVTWRIGFTGELSYELHVPAGYGEGIWRALVAAGVDLGVTPVGIEAQRVLRLEKGHLVVGQDTDGLTAGVSAGVDRAIRLDKADFVGKPELAWRRARGDHRRLVGLRPVDPEVVPAEASQIVEADGAAGERLVGRITSSRRSPTLGRGIALGYVPAHLAAPGSHVTVALGDGRRVAAVVTEHLAHVDPEGVRLRG